jgi:uncharacterized membrane protein YkoI
MRGSRRIALGAGVLLAATALVASADQGHERARQALQRGEILPLRAILDSAERDFLGRVVEVELEGGPPNAWIYEIEIIAPDGSVLRLTYDARAGDLIRATGRGLERARRPR